MENLKDRLDDNILHVIDKYYKKGDIPSKGEFYDYIKIQRQRVYQIKKRRARFTLEHVYLIKDYLGIDANELLTIKPES